MYIYIYTEFVTDPQVLLVCTDSVKGIASVKGILYIYTYIYMYRYILSS